MCLMKAVSLYLIQESDKKSAKELLLANRVAKKTKKRHKRLQRAMSAIKVRLGLYYLIHVANEVGRRLKQSSSF